MKIVTTVISLFPVLLLTAATNGTGVDSVRVSEAEEDAFRLSWDAVDGADGYVVNVWTNGVADASEGVEVLCERFSRVPSKDYSHLWSMNDVNGKGDYGHWVGEGMHGYEAKSEDDSEPAIVLGSTTASGWLRSEPLELSKETIVRLRLTRHTKDDTAPVLVAFLKNGETNFAESVKFGTAVHSFSDYTVIASNLTSGCQLLIASQKTGGQDFGRVAISEISVVSGYSPGMKIALPVVNELRVEGTSYLQERTSPVSYFFSVAAQGESVDENPIAGEVDMGDPPWLRCWRTSGFLPKPGVRALDLSGMDPIDSARDWVNGVDGDGLYAFMRANGVAKLRPFSAQATNYAVYQLKEDEGQDPAHGLGLLGNSTSEMRLVLPIRLDARRSLKTLSVSYVLSRLTWKDGTKNTELTFSWRTGDDIGAMEDLEAEWSEIKDGGFTFSAYDEDPVMCNVSITARQLQEAKYLFLQWSVPRQGSSAMIGMSNLAVGGALKDTGFCITIR